MWTKPIHSLDKRLPQPEQDSQVLLTRRAPPSSQEAGDVQEIKPLREITQEGIKGRVAKKLVTHQCWGRGPSGPWPGALSEQVQASQHPTTGKVHTSGRAVRGL